MKQIIIAILLGLLPFGIQAQISLVNDGSSLVIETGIDVKVENGSITNKNSGTINNNGKLYLDLGFTQNTSATYLGGTSSWLWFEGTANQNAIGDAVLNIARLKVDNGNRLVLGQSVNVSTSVDLNNNGSIELGTNNLVLATTATISNYNSSNYIITNSTGYLQQEVSATNVIFPVGNSIYNPATLNNIGTTDNFNVRVEDQVLDVYPAGNPETDGVVSKAWMIDEQVIGGSDITMTLQWDTGDELTNFDRTQSGISHWMSSAWDRSPTWTAATNVGGMSWTQTRNNITSFSPFSIEDIDIDLPVELLSFDAKRTSINLVQLNWVTSSETNNQGFDVERMLEGESTFTKVGWVDGNGTTTNTSYYSFDDENAFNAVSYYRLKQVDFDGSSKYSKIRAVRGWESNYSQVNVFPNPIHDYINIRINSTSKSASIQIHDSKGSEILTIQKTIPLDRMLHLNNLSKLIDGSYIISIVTDDGIQHTQKFIKE